MIYNYHTHTYLCNHATGTIEEYVVRAIEGGIKYMGFSGHIPFVGVDGLQSRYRIGTDEIDTYVSEVKRLRKKYKKQIDIKLGFEMEYYPENFDDMFRTALDSGAEYLIMGEHFVENETQEGVRPTLSATDDVSKLETYVNTVCEGIERGVFTYVAHPDIFFFDGDEDVYKEKMRILCRCAKKCDVPLEINLLGVREGRIYPRDIFWQVAGEEKVSVTIGFDAHNPIDAFDSVSLERANELIRKYKLNYIGMPKLVPLSK